jgi:hypothetical protein
MDEQMAVIGPLKAACPIEASAKASRENIDDLDVGNRPRLPRGRVGYP